MIQITPQMRILLAVQPVDFRKGIDGLGRTVLEVLESDPFSGHVFVFRNRPDTALKILMYDGQGFWLCQKRLSSGRLRWWPRPGEFEALLMRLARQKLDPSDYEILIQVVQAMGWMSHELEEKKLSIRRLRRIFGIQCITTQ